MTLVLLDFKMHPVRTMESISLNLLWFQYEFMVSFIWSRRSKENKNHKNLDVDLHSIPLDNLMYRFTPG